MAPPDVDHVARGLADLRLQVNALETVTKAASLPETVAQARRTVRWSAFVVALALVVSSVIRYVGDRHVDAFEKRLEHLEAGHDTSRP